MTAIASRRKQPKRSRAEWYDLVSRRYARGESGVSIARSLGISSSFVYDLLNDPDGSKTVARKNGYRRPCPGYDGTPCGRLMDGSNGRGPRSSRLCRVCQAERQHAERYWTRERIIEAIQRFAAEHGRPPHAKDWNHRGRGDGYPTLMSCYRTRFYQGPPFASWAEAIEAAGFPRPSSGRRPSDAHAWSRESIVEAIQRWAEKHGEPPTSTAWRRVGDDHPASRTVVYYFGRWNDAIRAAGFEPRRPGGYRRASVAA